MTIPNPKLLQQEKVKYHNTNITIYDIDIPDWPGLIGQWKVVFGIDPGNAHMGLTILPTQSTTWLPIRCYEINLPSERLAISRLTQIRLALSDIILLAVPWYYACDTDVLVSIEASAYSMPYRNTELAEARIVAAEWFMDNFHLTQNNFIFSSPQAIRKAVFGSAKIKAETQWPQLKGDAASSLAIALAGLALKSV